jgi:hypothetical protein
MSQSFKPGIGRLMAEARPVALPFYHHGMHEILPVGAKLPRRGKTVQVLFGEAVDCSEEYVQEVASMIGSHDTADLRLSEALSARAHEALRALDPRVHPAASQRG